ncbi:Pantothenate kinase 4 [Spironucleus salmonicida]|uniref:Pantothenate kinase 4 n=1 Tax=Spironucleus salmonicida TaxID=348837 RepID=V6LX19_9EUKA|nr:Pantothenate kinase 4 [Spironucleus salmonicida]|eukprot:EST48256.1 Pantothenate kinase 4 [Spironucleus salmonicida]
MIFQPFLILIIKPFWFLKSFFYYKTKYFPIASPNLKLKAASARLYNQLTELLIEECPLVSIDLGGTLMKLCIYIPDKYLFKVQQQFIHLFQPQHSFTSHVIRGKFLFFFFQQTDFNMLINFLNVHNFPFSYKKELRCTGGGAVKFRTQLLERTNFDSISQFDEIQSLHKGMMFLTGLKLKNEVYTLLGKAPVSCLQQPHRLNFDSRFFENHQPSDAIQQKINWFQHSQSASLSKYVYDVSWLYPCLLVQIGSGISILHVTQQNIVRVDGSALGGGVFLNLAKLLTHCEFDQLLKLETQGHASKLQFNGAQFSAPIFQNEFAKADVVAALAEMVSENAAQLACLNCKIKHLTRVVFAGGFISNQPVVQESIQRVLAENGIDGIFLSHDAVLGSIGALLGDGVEFGAGNDEIETFVSEVMREIAKEESEVHSVESWEIQ